MTQQVREWRKWCDENRKHPQIGTAIQNAQSWDPTGLAEILAFVAEHGPVEVTPQFEEWINEDELPEGYPYHSMYPHSKLGQDGRGGVRIFPKLPVPIQPGEWISVQDKLPETAALVNPKVWVWDELWQTQYECWWEDGEFVPTGERDERQRVTHWMSLPNPPAAEAVAPTPTPWISVSEQLPERSLTWQDGPHTYRQSEVVLVFDKGWGRITARCEGGGTFSSITGEILREVTHWQTVTPEPISAALAEAQSPTACPKLGSEERGEDV